MKNAYEMLFNVRFNEERDLSPWRLKILEELKSKTVKEDKLALSCNVQLIPSFQQRKLALYSKSF